MTMDQVKRSESCAGVNYGVVNQCSLMEMIIPLMVQANQIFGYLLLASVVVSLNGAITLCAVW